MISKFTPCSGVSLNLSVNTEKLFKIEGNRPSVKHLTYSMSVSMKRSVIQSLSLSLTILTISQQNDRKENLKAIRILKNFVFRRKEEESVPVSSFNMTSDST